MSGQLIRTLVNQLQQPGEYTVEWDGRNQAGARVGSGVYINRMSAGQFVATQKLILLK